ncbi:hypothetical protein ACFVFH_14345 [Streptomyces sp. NPDC057697]|uniref:hypothetical protein n=1 Tax=Streptomyces sp. NPDC057697 TaxID=3346219 RepID=UPI0036AEB14C
MATLTVWKVPSAEGAGGVETPLKPLRKVGPIRIVDAAGAGRPADRAEPRAEQSLGPAGAGAPGGMLTHSDLDARSEERPRETFGDEAA